MWGELSDKSRKYEAARKALDSLLKNDLGEANIALRMYGHRRKNDCSDSELVVPFGTQTQNSKSILKAMNTVRPTGRTPIDRSLRAALDDFGGKTGTIVLISDGVESCDADPCALVKSWQDKDIDIKLHVVGLGLTGKERVAMQCIADAANTPYRDAFSTSELEESLQTTLESATRDRNDSNKTASNSNPEPDATEPDLALQITTPDGARHRGKGILTPKAGGEGIPIETFMRHTPPPGEYTFEGGITAVGGNIYKNQQLDVTVQQQGRTIIKLESDFPPLVSARFEMDGEAIRETVVIVYQDGKKLGSFKGNATAFVPEGKLEFRTKIAQSSQTLFVTETFKSGDEKEIGFVAEKEVKLVIKLNLTTAGTQLKSKPTLNLLQNGEVAKKLNAANGGFVIPGTYLLHADDAVNVFEQEITVTDEDTQNLAIDVPSGAITVTYQDKDGKSEKPKRVFISREGKKRRVVRTSDEPIGLVPGTYIVSGHPKKAEYPKVTVTVIDGSSETIPLKATK